MKVVPDLSNSGIQQKSVSLKFVDLVDIGTGYVLSIPRRGPTAASKPVLSAQEFAERLREAGAGGEVLDAT